MSKFNWIKSKFGIIIFLCLFLCVSDLRCHNCSEYSWGYPANKFDSYSVNNIQLTPKGIQFDPSGQDISPLLIDHLTDEVEECLIKHFPNAKLSDHVYTYATCESKSIDIPIERSSFVVKITNDWVLSCDKSDQLLQTTADDIGCYQKGLIPTQECPCRYRAGIKCPNILITTPSMYLYKDVLIRFVTSCQNTWSVDELSECATPTTDPLSDGSE